MDLNTLLAAVEAGQRFRFRMFWGHRARADGRIGDSCFSQWWPCEFQVDGVTYASAEHYMMAGKARLFGDTGALQQILEAPTPAAAKKLGRKVKAFDGPTWDAHGFDIVVQGNLAKFSQDPRLKAHLLGTGDAVLVEAAPNDRSWGIGLVASDPRSQDPRHWRGNNLLGFALMSVRTQLKERSS